MNVRRGSMDVRRGGVYDRRMASGHKRCCMVCGHKRSGDHRQHLLSDSMVDGVRIVGGGIRCHDRSGERWSGDQGGVMMGNGQHAGLDGGQGDDGENLRFCGIDV